MPVEELRTGQSSNQTLPVCHPLKTVSGWETASAFQPKSPQPLSPAGSGLWHPTSPVIPNGRSQPVFPYFTSLITFLLKVGWFWNSTGEPALVSCIFPLRTICSQAGLQLPPVKKQIALAQGQDRSPGALPASCGFTLNTESSVPGCCFPWNSHLLPQGNT